MAGLWVTNANFGEMIGTIARYATARIAPHPATIDKVEVTRMFRWVDAGRCRTTVLLRPRREVKQIRPRAEKRAVAKPTSPTVKRRALMTQKINPAPACRRELTMR